MKYNAKVIDNFMPAEMWQEFKTYIKQELNNGGWRHAHNDYQELDILNLGAGQKLAVGTEANFKLEKNDDMFYKPLSAEWKDRIVQFMIDKKYWTRKPKEGSTFHLHVLWPLTSTKYHLDQDAAATFYINEDWDYNWGGQLIWKHINDTVGEYLEIRPNRIIFLKNDVEHNVTTTAMEADKRLTIQMFFDADIYNPDLFTEAGVVQ